MQEVVKTITKTSPEGLPALHVFLGSKDTRGVLERHGEHIDQTLATLDPAVHTVGYIHLLHVRSKKPGNNFVNHALTLAQIGDAHQIRLAALCFAEILEAMCAQAPKSGYRQLLVPLRRACQIFDAEDPHRLVPVHSLFLERCYFAQHFNAALPVLQQFKYRIAAPATHGTRVLHVLRYFFFAGMILCGRQAWSAALDHFLQCLSVPAASVEVVSAFQLQAYKKAVLCSVLAASAAGRSMQLSLPQHVAQKHDRLFRPYVECYSSFAQICESGCTWAVDKAITSLGRVLAEDGNLGLAKQARQAVVRRNIAKLTENFSTLSLNQLAQQAGLSSPAEAERLVLRMVADGDIQARIDQRQGMVSFRGIDAEDRFNNPAAVQIMHSKVRDILQLNEVLREADRQLRTSNRFVVAFGDSGGVSPSAASAAVGSPLDAYDEDAQLREAMELSQLEQ